jgi:hypothetical protein
MDKSKVNSTGEAQEPLKYPHRIGTLEEIEGDREREAQEWIAEGNGVDPTSGRITRKTIDAAITASEKGQK